MVCESPSRQRQPGLDGPVAVTDDELSAAWRGGATLKALQAMTGRTKDSLQKYLGRKRAAEGEERWPRRANPIKAQVRAAAPQPQIKRATGPTLPPLPSLSSE